ncbi:ELN protein, partial [Pachyramphus minor]|nr:ELN protein [Pachyramphus minor]
LSAAGIRFPGVGVLPGVPTGAGVKPKAPGRSLNPLGTLSWLAERGRSTATGSQLLTPHLLSSPGGYGLPYTNGKLPHTGLVAGKAGYPTGTGTLQPRSPRVWAVPGVGGVPGLVPGVGAVPGLVPGVGAVPGVAGDCSQEPCPQHPALWGPLTAPPLFPTGAGVPGVGVPGVGVPGVGVPGVGVGVPGLVPGVGAVPGLVPGVGAVPGVA